MVYPSLCHERLTCMKPIKLPCPWAARARPMEIKTKGKMKFEYLSLTSFLLGRLNWLYPSNEAALFPVYPSFP